MSKINLPIAELRPALAGLGKVIAKRATLPVLSHLKIERTREGWIALTATDLDSFITVRLEQPSDEESLSMLVPYDELLKITKTCSKTDSILIRSGENPSVTSVTIQYAVGNQVAETTVATLPPSEFPEIPKLKGDAMPITDNLRQSIQQAMDCASTDETRYVLNGACIDVSNKEGHYVVGTNGSVLFSSNSFTMPLEQSVIIPSHKFLSFREFNNDGGWQFKAANPETKDGHPWLQLSSRRWRFISKQIEGNYPNWRQVIPEESKFTTSILFTDPAALADAIERLPDHDPVYHAVGIERTGNTVHLLWKSDKEQPWKHLEVKHERRKGVETTVFVNRHYLVKALRFGLGRLQLGDSLSPMRFSQDGRQLIVMPVRTDSTPPAATQTQEPPTEPAATSPAAPPENPPPMVNDNTSTTASTSEPLTIDGQLDQLIEEVEAMKDTTQDHLTGLKSLGSKLKSIQREHKASNKELNSIRQTLKGLQSVKL